MADISQFRFPTDIRFGVGGRCELAEFARKYKVSRPLLVTDSGLLKTEAFELLEEQMNIIWPGAFARFTDVHPNPTDRDVEGALSAYLEGKCDGVVGLGGGSALDAARALRLKVAFPDAELMEMPFNELGQLVPMCAIPTTAGTGSEVGRSSVITIQKMGRKAIFGAQPLMAEMAILDPELTVGLPSNLTASTGMDAMTHAIEALVCTVFHPMCDAIALEAIRMVWLYLPRAYSNGTDIEARGMMQVAAAMGAVAFQKDLGAAHSLSHPLSSEFGIQHGLANAICLTPVMKYNKEVSAAQYARVAQCFGINTFDMSESEAAEKAIEAIQDLNKRIGIPKSLSEVGIKEDQLEMLAKKAFEDPCHPSNPRPCTEQDLLMLYKEAF
ncbi:MAG: iron-containing alcohol dehydrogenase [Planctomycetes bacterium]|nr:iron-containing alcohol dehydrogenase [Planctomycetota bacterium]MBL7142881.1 iron-containing alcohol dehydrogenase [Phycisphaerae bacterium]